MKINKVTITKHCFGEDIEIDGKDIKEIPRKYLEKWMATKISKMEEYSFQEILKTVMWSECEDTDSLYNDICEQCGDHNSQTELLFS